MDKATNRNRWVRKLYQMVKRYDAKRLNPDGRIIFARIRRAVTSRAPLTFLMFTCSTINSEYLFSKTPWRYVSTRVRGNNLELNIPQLEQIFRNMKRVYPRIRLVILIGNTDPYYIYLRQFAAYSYQNRQLLTAKFNARWQRYRRNLERWLTRNFQFSDLRVISWYQLERTREKQDGIRFEVLFTRTRRNLNACFSREERRWELENLRTQFGPGRYFAKLETPPESLLRDWVARKFAEYAVQGLWLWELFPNAILIQNEKPSDLRYRMYQPLIREKYRTVLPNVYFFGVDNQGFG